MHKVVALLQGRLHGGMSRESQVGVNKQSHTGRFPLLHTPQSGNTKSPVVARAKQRLDNCPAETLWRKAKPQVKARPDFLQGPEMLQILWTMGIHLLPFIKLALLFLRLQYNYIMPSSLSSSKPSIYPLLLFFKFMASTLQSKSLMMLTTIHKLWSGLSAQNTPITPSCLNGSIFGNLSGHVLMIFRYICQSPRDYERFNIEDCVFDC